MKIWVHRYQLVSKPPGALAREGALLKVEWMPGEIGYSDLHPWPEFGEPPLHEHILSLSNKKFTPLVQIALEFNSIDRVYRGLKRSAFWGLGLPRSHKLVTEMRFVESAQLVDWQKAGFTHIKVKMGKDLIGETDLLRQWSMHYPDWFWRIDINARLTVSEFTSWWKSLDDRIKTKIDFIEDPVTNGERIPFSGPWAQDWTTCPGAQVRVFKPAHESISLERGFKRVIFTHSLDHPLGQSAAAWSAAKFYAKNPSMKEVCGLAAAEGYITDAFSQAWFCAGPRMQPPPGNGFGFDEHLEALTWEPLT